MEKVSGRAALTGLTPFWNADVERDNLARMASDPSPPSAASRANLELLLGLVQRLNISVEALAAVAARLRLRSEALTPDPVVTRMLQGISDAVGVPSVATLSNEQIQMVTGNVRSMLRQALDLVEQPERAPGWVYSDPVVLQSQGRASMLVAAVLQSVAPQLAGLDAALRGAAGEFLDIGTGVGWLAVAMARAFPALRVLGVDIWEPSLALARANIAQSQLEARIELRQQDARELPEQDRFDLCWCAGPFVPKPFVAEVLGRIRQALRPGGWLAFGLYGAPPDPLAERLNELRITRWGGHPWSEAESEAQLRAAGFVEVRALPKAWQAPVKLVVGRKA
jgi:SAM-dependent methyltransferase